MRIFLLLFTVIFAFIFPAELFSQGEIKTMSLFSKALQKTKYFNIYLPPDFNQTPEAKYPVIYFLHGWGSSRNGGDRIMHYADSLITYGIIDPILIVCAGNSTEPFGGSHYMNSILWGNYEDYMVVDLLKRMDESGRTLPGRENRFLMGQSMGGYGSFRYGVFHKDKFSAIAAHGAPINYNLIIEKIRSAIISEAGTEAPYFFKYSNGKFTKHVFANAGAYSPNLKATQDYIFPQNVDFPFDEYGEIIDTIFQEFILNDPATFIKELRPEDSVGLLFGCGSRDEFGLYPGNIALPETLDSLGLEYEFYDHNGKHGMPEAFIDKALKYFDSLLKEANAKTD